MASLPDWITVVRFLRPVGGRTIVVCVRVHISPWYDPTPIQAANEGA